MPEQIPLDTTTELLCQVGTLPQNYPASTEKGNFRRICPRRGQNPQRKNLWTRSLADSLGIDISCISVKGKTAEKLLGELGSGDAVVAQALALVE